VAAVIGGGVFLASGSADTLGSSSRFGELSKWLRPSGETVLAHSVRRGSLVVTVKEQGTLESANNLEARSEVEGQPTIISILPEGTRVTKGEKVCELDSAALKDELTNQEITTSRAEADLNNAQKTLEVAQINVEEYTKGLYPQELKQIEGEIKLAQSDLERAKDKLDWSNQMYKQGYITQAQNLSDKYELQRAEFAYQSSLKKKEVLQDYTYKRQVKQLEGDVEKARSDMLAKKSTYQLEKDKEKKLRDMIEKCTIYAPGNGIVVYHQEESRWGNNEGPSIEEGATVRERQIIFKLPDIDNMQVNTKVHESMIDRVKPGLSARIRVDAFPNQQLNGTVKEVALLPDATSFFSSDIKVYTTVVSIDNGHDDLRPGMSAEVEILIARLDDVLSVPVQCVKEFDGEYHVWVKRPEGWASRVIELGMSNSKFVEVKDGLVEGDRVAMNPLAVMTSQEERKIYSSDGESKKGGEKAGDWNEEDAEKADALAKQPGRERGGEGGPGAGAGGGRGGAAGGAMRAIFQKVGPEDRRKLFDPSTSDEERTRILKDAGATDAQIQQMEQMRQQFGGGQGGPGGPGGGPGGRGGGQFGGGRGGSGQ